MKVFNNVKIWNKEGCFGNETYSEIECDSKDGVVKIIFIRWMIWYGLKLAIKPNKLGANIHSLPNFNFLTYTTVHSVVFLKRNESQCFYEFEKVFSII